MMVGVSAQQTKGYYRDTSAKKLVHTDQKAQDKVINTKYKGDISFLKKRVKTY